MTLPRDLLEQAQFLCRRERQRPRQASLRRAVSAAYYALFHALIEAAVQHLGRGTPVPLRQLMARAFSHGDMQSACKQWATGSLPSHLASVMATPLEPELKQVAKAFVELQEQRHRADYDLSATFTRVGADLLVTQAEDAFRAWDRVAGSANAGVFLSSLLLGKAWKR